MTEVMYKVCRLEYGVPTSVTATGAALTQYPMRKPITAHLADKGYGFLVFDDLHLALRFSQEADVFQSGAFAVYEAECEDEMELPLRFMGAMYHWLTHYLETGEAISSTTDWPRGTRMYKTVTLLGLA